MLRTLLSRHPQPNMISFIDRETEVLRMKSVAWGHTANKWQTLRPPPNCAAPGNDTGPGEEGPSLAFGCSRGISSYTFLDC